MEGAIYSVTTEEGIKYRNSLHNRVKADAFIPAGMDLLFDLAYTFEGGRPNTINKFNWKSFLLENGNPSSSIIVEAANLFITPKAREEMFNVGLNLLLDMNMIYVLGDWHNDR